MKSKSTITKIKNTAKKTAKKTGETVANNPKTALYVGLGIVTVFAAVKAYRIFFPKGKQLDDIGGNDLSFPPASISQVQAKIIAERLYNAMLVSFDLDGTDVDEIFDALTGLTVNDFKKVYEAFGLRQYSIFWGNVGDPFFSDKHDLIVWLTNELSTNDINELRALIPGLNI